MNANSALTALVVALPFAGNCVSTETSRAGSDDLATCFRSADGQIQARLTRTAPRTGEQLHGVTELESGARLVEDVTLDGAGAVVRAEMVLSEAGDRSRTRIELDPASGLVVINSAAVRAQWTVPRDFPWVWASLLTSASGEALATPLDASIVWRAAAHAPTVRLLDLANLRSYSVMSDQVWVPEGGGGTVVLGNDTIEIAEGMPTSLELKALHTNLLRADSVVPTSPILAVAGCMPARGSLAR